MIILKWSVFYLFALANLSSVFSIEIRIFGPAGVITGDYEKYTCEITGEDLSPNYGLEWKFKLKNGEMVSMNDSDILTALEVRNHTPEHLTVSSFLRVDNPETENVICQHSPKISASLDIQVLDLAAITADNDPCTKAESSGKPITSVFMPSTDLLSPAYRRSHIIDDKYVSLTYGSEVSEVKLVCYSPSNLNPPMWSFNKEMSSKMKYAVWAKQQLPLTCKQQVLHIYQVAGESGHLTNLTFDCSTGASSTNVHLGFQFSHARSGMDFNATENCVNEIVEQFYNKELTGVGIGSSFVIVLMMFGMAMLKRQLNQQKNINQSLQPSTNPSQVNANGNGVSSTDNLYPSAPSA